MINTETVTAVKAALPDFSAKEVWLMFSQFASAKERSLLALAKSGFIGVGRFILTVPGTGDYVVDTGTQLILMGRCGDETTWDYDQVDALIAKVAEGVQ